MTDGELSVAINAGVAGAQLVTRIIEMIVGNAGLSAEQRAEAIARISAELPARDSLVQADQARVATEDDKLRNSIPEPAPTAR